MKKNNVHVRATNEVEENAVKVELLEKVREYKELQKMTEELEEKVNEVKGTL